MTVTYDIFEIDKPITTIEHNEEYGYYIGANNVKDIIDNYIKAEEYDHIFVAYKLGENLHKERIRTGDWIGLGGMTYGNDIGFSNIRVPNENSTLLYKYTAYNTFPEEVYVHEFLHGLERIDEEHGNEIISLHANEEYGYKEKDTSGLKEWYRDYLQSKITLDKIGLNKNVFKEKPIHESDFVNAIDLTKEHFEQPENLKEEMMLILKEIKNYFNINFKIENKKYLEESIGSIRI